jgi:hypothetical protein
MFIVSVSTRIAEVNVIRVLSILIAGATHLHLRMIIVADIGLRLSSAVAVPSDCSYCFDATPIVSCSFCTYGYRWLCQGDCCLYSLHCLKTHLT